MKIVQEHSCFPLQRNFEISGGIFFVYIWCSPKSLKLTIVEDKLFKTDFRIHTLSAKLNYGHQQRIIIYLWGCPNQQHMQSHPILCVLKNISFFIKKKTHTAKPGICPGNRSLLTIKAAQDKAASHPSTSKLQMGFARSTKKVDESKPLRLKAITKSVAFSETPKWAI